MDVTVKMFKDGKPIMVKANIYTVYDSTDSGDMVVKLQKIIAKTAKKSGWMVC